MTDADAAYLRMLKSWRGYDGPFWRKVKREASRAAATIPTGDQWGR